MPSPDIRPQPQHPITIVRNAVLWARASKLPVRLGAWGVHCISTYAPIRWERDPRAAGIDPIGAAILHAQPQATELYAAAAEAMSAPAAWVHGFQEALDHEEPSASWIESLQRRLYLAGYEAGTMYREDFIRVRPATVRL